MYGWYIIYLWYEFQGPGIILLGYGPVRQGGRLSPSLLVKPFKPIADGIPKRTAVLNMFISGDILLLLFLFRPAVVTVL